MERCDNKQSWDNEFDIRRAYANHTSSIGMSTVVMSMVEYNNMINILRDSVWEMFHQSIWTTIFLLCRFDYWRRLTVRASRRTNFEIRPTGTREQILAAAESDKVNTGVQGWRYGAEILEWYPWKSQNKKKRSGEKSLTILGINYDLSIWDKLLLTGPGYGVGKWPDRSSTRRGDPDC